MSAGWWSWGTAELAIWGVIVVCIVLVVISIARGSRIRIDDTDPN